MDADRDAPPVEFGKERLVAESPRYMPPVLVSMVTPSLPSWLVAYSSSFRAASTSGTGREAKCPNRAGWSRRISAPASLTCRASAMASAGFPKETPGEEIDKIEVAMPQWSIRSRCRATSQAGQSSMPSGCTIPTSLAAWTYRSVRKWECTSTSGVRARVELVIVTSFQGRGAAVDVAQASAEA
jgi:hypothetical protein